MAKTMRKVDPAKIVREIMKRDESYEGTLTLTFTKGRGITNIREGYDIPLENPMSFKECEDSFFNGLTEEQKKEAVRHYVGFQGYRYWGKISTSTASMAHGKVTKLHVDRSVSIEKFLES